VSIPPYFTTCIQAVQNTSQATDVCFNGHLTFVHSCKCHHVLQGWTSLCCAQVHKLPSLLCHTSHENLQLWILEPAKIKVQFTSYVQPPTVLFFKGTPLFQLPGLQSVVPTCNGSLFKILSWILSRNTKNLWEYSKKMIKPVIWFNLFK